MALIKGIKNERPFYYFEEISKIPRGSRNEEGIADYIVELAKAHSLDYYRDGANNVLVTKKSSKGKEAEDTVMLQAHTDMVCEKNNNKVHNFDTDPIELIQEGNILRANDTTLGADDGFGVAIMLAILESDILSPRLECLFTSSEEIGLVGAGAFDYTRIKAKQMINLDSAEENTVIIGCCGGVRTDITLPVTVENNTKTAYKLKIGGLCGGHSGEDIDKGRLNAHILMGIALNLLRKETEFKISYISGGDKDNAIPRECECVVVPNSDIALEKAKDKITSEILNKAVATEDKGLTFNIEKTDTPSTFSLCDTEKILEILSVPNAVLEYRDKAPILPSISRNLARIRTEENEIKIGFSSRAYSKAGLDFSCAQLEALVEKIGASYRHHERYPSWQDEPNSPLVLKWQGAYSEATGRKTEPTLIHAGLECGLITSAVEGLSAISVGANVHDLHTPKETMEIDSMDRIYDTVCTFLSK